MTHRITRRHVNAGIGAALISPAWASTSAFAQGGEPIKIGFGMALTGPLAANGKQALLGAKIWEEEINAKGGLLGRPGQARLLRRSDPIRRPCRASTRSCSTSTRSTSSSAPMATNLMAPAHAGRHAKGQDLHRLVRARCEPRISISEILLDACRPGPTPRQSFTEGFFQVAAAQNPKPQTVALAAEDAEFSRNAARAPARTPRSTASRSSTTKPTRPARPTSRRSSARSRRPIRISW